uniref:Putative secreted peptide n=1 Tax=Anopheles braziliensis TaxID=58242 RepID=A0A2M3ZRF9_9DIPT
MVAMVVAFLFHTTLPCWLGWLFPKIYLKSYLRKTRLGYGYWLMRVSTVPPDGCGNGCSNTGQARILPTARRNVSRCPRWLFGASGGGWFRWTKFGSAIESDVNVGVECVARLLDI